MSTPAVASDARRLLQVFLFTDLAGSTELKRRLGDLDGARAIARHNQLFRRLLHEHEGVERDFTGDGFFASFDVPSHAVFFALAFQQELARLDAAIPLRARIGIHIGETLLMDEGRGPGHEILLGLAVDTTARVMGLALPGQILLTPHAFDSVRQYVVPDHDVGRVEWLAHGPYRFKGVEEPLEVFEVGLRGFSPLEPPPSSAKATRDVHPADEEILGWRPAAGLEVPGRHGWKLERRLGEGGFGEVWLARHEAICETRVFKFCFQSDRVRGLKREVALFRLLKETLGDRIDIARILDWHIDEPPYFLDSEYTEGGSLVDWAERQGGLEQVPLATRLELVAQVADALAAAHRVGVLHKDLKPSNVLIASDGAGAPRARLADFGIGLVTDPELLAARGIPWTGLTIPRASDGGSSSGTPLYMAPELLEGSPATTQSDVYALGVMLYQLAAGCLRGALGVGWERRVDDELLRADITACVDATPERRLESAAELARRLRALGARRAAVEAERAAAAGAATARQAAADARRGRERRRYAVTVALILLAVAGVAASAWQLGRSRRAITGAQDAILRQTMQTNLAAAHWVSEALKRQLATARDVVERTARRDEMREAFAQGNWQAIGERLERMRTRLTRTGISSWALADADGRIQARAPFDPSVVGSAFRDRDWFHGGTPEAGPIRATHISEPYVSRSQEAPEMIAVSTPIWRAGSEGGTPSGVLVASVTLADLRRWVQDVPQLAGPDSPEVDGLGLRVVVINDRDQIVLHPENPLAPGQPPMKWPGLGFRPRPFGAERLEDPLDHRLYLAGWTTDDSDQWIVVVEEAEERARRPLEPLAEHTRQLGWMTLGVGLFGAAVLLGWLWVIIGHAREVSRSESTRRATA